MKALAPLLLAGAVSAQPVPMTQELAQSIQGLIHSTIAVCQKRKITPEQCSKEIDATVVGIRKKVDEVCKEYPKERVQCTQYGLEHLMDAEIMKNIRILNSQSV